MIKWNSHMNKLSTKSDGNLIRVTDKKNTSYLNFHYKQNKDCLCQQDLSKLKPVHEVS